MALLLSGCVGAPEAGTAPAETTVPTATLPPTTSTTMLAWGPLSFERSDQVFERTETVQIGIGDLDGDGDVDAVFANMGAHESAVWLNDGDGFFVDSGQALTEQGHGVGVGDLDGDGDLDAAITCAHLLAGGGWSNLPSLVYLNDGTGMLSDGDRDLGDGGLSGVALHLLDVDGDGSLDIYVEYYEPDGQADRVYLNDGAGGFSDSGLLLGDDEIAWGDPDGDGDLDLLGKRYGEGYLVRRNDGSGR
ncbi:MAG: VCBS repeat-containing protein, partial [Actinomycetota bacterium]